MAADPEIIDRLDRIQATIAVAFAPQIGEFRERILGDPANQAILEAAADWITAGKLQTAVMKSTKQSDRTVKRRIADLVAGGVLAKQGSGGNVSYKATGLI